jgi:hypothetical protein
MPHRVSPTERIRGHIDELFAQDKQLPEILEEVARLGAKLLMQAALEAEITELETGRNRGRLGWGTGSSTAALASLNGVASTRQPPDLCREPGGLI